MFIYQCHVAIWLSSVKTLVFLVPPAHHNSLHPLHRFVLSNGRDVGSHQRAYKDGAVKEAQEDTASPPEQKESAGDEPSPPASSAAMEEVTHVMGTSEKKKSEESPPSDKPEEKKSEESPPSDKIEEKKPEVSPPSGKIEEKTSVEDPPLQPKESKKSPPPADEDTDILEFTSGTEGEASSSAWELVPEKKIARKIGVKSDSELDHLIKKVVKEEAEQRQLTSQAAASAVTAAAAAAVTSSLGATSTTVKDLLRRSLKNLLLKLQKLLAPRPRRKWRRNESPPKMM